MKRALIGSALFAATGLGVFAVASTFVSAGDDGWVISHDRFIDYVAEAEAVFGPVELGESCDDWPERTPDDLAHLAVLPAVGEGPECQVIGWTYASPFAVLGLRDDAFVGDGLLVRPAVFDATGNLLTHFDSPETTGGSLTLEQLAELDERSG